MTNAEKYLKDEMLLKDFISDYIEYCRGKNKDSVYFESLSLFLRAEAKATLTEDERVILRNIDLQNFKAIGRKDDYLYLRYTDWSFDYGDTDIKTLTFWYMYHDLFKFIKERRRI